MKKFILGILSVFHILTLTACSVVSGVPETVTIDGVTYRNGFYEGLWPVFGQVGYIGSETLQEEVIYDDGTRKFRRVDFEGHDWVHSYTGGTTNGVVYCEESQWEQEYAYYSDSSNFLYYGGGSLKPDIDPEKFDELLSFADKNRYKPFGSNKGVETRDLPIPDRDESPKLSFFRVSNDGYFVSYKGDTYHIVDGKLVLVFYYDYGHGEYKKLVAVDVPEELGQYFIDLLAQH